MKAQSSYSRQSRNPFGLFVMQLDDGREEAARYVTSAHGERNLTFRWRLQASV